MQRKRRIGPKQVEILEALEREPQDMTGFAQRGWRSYPALIERGLAAWDFGKVKITDAGREELAQARRRQAYRENPEQFVAGQPGQGGAAGKEAQ